MNTKSISIGYVRIIPLTNKNTIKSVSILYVGTNSIKNQFFGQA
jgi:hypothetical protein